MIIKRKLAALFVALALTAGYSTLAQAHKRLTATPCRTSSDTVGVATNAIKQLFAMNGVDTSGIAVVTDSATCQAIVNGYNADSSAASTVASGYVLHSDSTYVLYLPGSSSADNVERYFLFNATFQIIGRLAGGL